MKLFKRHKKSAFPEANHVILSGFTFDGTEYFYFDDTFNLPYRRGLAAIKYYEEFRMRCTREYLELHTQALDEILLTKIDSVFSLADMVKKINQLNEFMKERLKFALEGETLYKFASIVFFDKSESPYDYDPKYNLAKIAKWKTSPEAHTFFLQQPIRKLIPYLQASDESTPDYLETVAKVAAFHLESLLSHISDESKRTSLRKKFGFAEAMPAESSN